ncbi:GspH/FimT family pseudopilin [Spartinivicinus poritis]|uniref:Type II secretion system protein H n=1 Tax=Spartinivicinus poritis TaxID=2994640 RepID=A0ABT5UCI1_9GAMM|nr:GspH/FimT family pseudopilin [Spartinivicinus sp. A2-2]MDE1464091.1 GspH/FimT family pseudopilin [Spartinivicinus sp. A2-2]
MIKKTTGFTLIELMVTIAVLAIIAGIGIPSMSNFIDNNRMNSAKDRLAAAISLARSDAITNNTITFICGLKTADASECSDTGEWKFGWMVFSDKNGNNKYDKKTDKDEGELVRVDRLSDNSIQYAIHQEAAAKTVKAIYYRPNGLAGAKIGSDSALLAKSLTISICKSSFKTALSLGMIGSAMTKKDQAKDCVEEKKN